MSLSLSHISKSYGHQVVLDQVDFNASQGEVTALIGKNGSGKTTTFKIICGLISSDEGQLQWDNGLIDPTMNSWKKNVGYLAEHNPLYPNLYVKEFLKYSCNLNRIPLEKELISEVIDKVGLESHQNKKIKHLSRGYKQRVGIAQAIIHNPSLLILDEPTSGLDPSQLVEIRALIKSLAKERIVILSSHILSEVEQICDSIHILDSGKIRLHSGTTNQLIIRVLFNSKPKEQWFKSLGEIQSINDKELSIQVSSLESREEIFDIAVSKNLKILEMKQESETLEHAFITSGS